MRAQIIQPTKDDISKLYTPTERNESEDAKICLYCKQLTCKGECKYFRQEKRKLKEVKNEKQRKTSKP